jgi:ubiquitin C-terminal hydrolase
MNIIDVYVSLVQSMWSGDDKCVTPWELKQCISRLTPIFSNYGQHDSHEFMNTLLNALQKVDSTSFFVNLFQIHTQSKATCNKCQNVDMTEETTTFLPLSIPHLKPHDNTKVLLKDLIKDFCQEDALDGQYYCQNCESCQSARHQTTIIQPLPRALIIQLKRFPFDDTNRKIDTLIQYKLEHENLLSTNDKYKLYAVSMHSGSLAGGHYTTMARNYINDRWYRFDDSHVEEIDSKSVVVPFNARQAYVLIYLKHNE